jgi:hypothetical protein
LDSVRFGSLLLALGAEYDRMPGGAKTGLILRGDGAGESQDLGRSVHGRMSDQCDKSSIDIGDEDRKAYTDISLELVDVLVSRIEEMVADQMSDPLSSSSSSFIASEVTIEDRVAGITAKGESGSS